MLAFYREKSCWHTYLLPNFINAPWNFVFKLLDGDWLADSSVDLKEACLTMSNRGISAAYWLCCFGRSRAREILMKWIYCGVSYITCVETTCHLCFNHPILATKSCLALAIHCNWIPSIIFKENWSNDSSSTECIQHSKFVFWMAWCFTNCPWIFISPYFLLVDVAIETEMDKYNMSNTGVWEQCFRVIS